MLRLGKLLPLALMLLAGAAQIGCRACGSPYDYAPPVADCDCYGSCRSGSACSPTFAANQEEGAVAGEEEISIAAAPEEPAAEEVLTR